MEKCLYKLIIRKNDYGLNNSEDSKINCFKLLTELPAEDDFVNITTEFIKEFPDEIAADALIEVEKYILQITYGMKHPFNV